MLNKIGNHFTGKFLQNYFFLPGTYFLSSESNSSCEDLKFQFGIAPKALWSVPNKQNLSFYLIFHASSRPTFPSVWPGPYRPFPGIIYRYRPSIPPTSPHPTLPSNFFSKFPPVIASPYTKPIITGETLVSSLPIGKFQFNFNTTTGPGRRGSAHFFKNDSC